jgi:hypothetical protein
MRRGASIAMLVASFACVRQTQLAAPSLEGQSAVLIIDEGDPPRAYAVAVQNGRAAALPSFAGASADLYVLAYAGALSDLGLKPGPIALSSMPSSNAPAPSSVQVSRVSSSSGQTPWAAAAMLPDRIKTVVDSIPWNVPADPCMGLAAQITFVHRPLPTTSPLLFAIAYSDRIHMVVGTTDQQLFTVTSTAIWTTGVEQRSQYVGALTAYGGVLFVGAHGELDVSLLSKRSSTRLSSGTPGLDVLDADGVGATSAARVTALSKNGSLFEFGPNGWIERVPLAIDNIVHGEAHTELTVFTSHAFVTSARPDGSTRTTLLYSDGMRSDSADWNEAMPGESITTALIIGGFGAYVGTSLGRIRAWLVTTTDMDANPAPTRSEPLRSLAYNTGWSFALDDHVLRAWDTLKGTTCDLPFDRRGHDVRLRTSASIALVDFTTPEVIFVEGFPF